MRRRIIDTSDETTNETTAVAAIASGAGGSQTHYTAAWKPNTLT